MIRVFLDANVLFSAALRPRDRDYAFFRLAREGGCVLLTSAYALDEARTNLAGKAPTALPRLDGEPVGALELVGEPTEAMTALSAAEGLPEKDAPILAAAVAAAADLLVTGDRRHFGGLFGRTVHGVRILSLADGLAELLAAVNPE